MVILEELEQKDLRAIFVQVMLVRLILVMTVSFCFREMREERFIVTIGKIPKFIES